MAQEFKLCQDTLAANGIPDNTNFLQWPVSKLHTDGFTLGLIADEEGKNNTSKNHWAVIVETPQQDFRVSMESQMNSRTGELGLLVLKRLRYKGKSLSVLYRESFTWQNSETKVKDVLLFILTRGWHKYKMLTTPEGAFKGCRHHL